MPQRLSRRKLATYVAGLVLDKKTDQAVQELAAFLVETRRTKELALIVRDVEAIMASKGVIVGTVTTAFELSDAAKKAIEAQVAAQLGAKDVSLSPVIDKSVIGGTKIRVPGYESDQTVAHTLTVLKTRFKKA